MFPVQKPMMLLRNERHARNEPVSDRETHSSFFSNEYRGKLLKESSGEEVQCSKKAPEAFICTSLALPCFRFLYHFCLVICTR